MHIATCLAGSARSVASHQGSATYNQAMPAMTRGMIMRAAANISFLFQELPFEQRFAAARKNGFEGIEILFPYEHEAERIRELAVAAGVKMVLFNTPPGNRAGGE